MYRNVSPQISDRDLDRSIKIAEAHAFLFEQLKACNRLANRAYTRWSIDVIKSNYPTFFEITIRNVMNQAILLNQDEMGPLEKKKVEELTTEDVQKISKIIQEGLRSW